MTAIPLKQIEGKYEILEKLREGGMGAIYKVRHVLLDEVRVIKVMRQQLVQDEELRGRFQREARLAIKLRHPNIAQLYDFTVDDDGTAFIVMEFIGGLTLEDVLKTSGPPPPGLALEIAQQSLRALGYLHGKGMIHRDISPDNLMLTEDADGDPLVKLIDLGIAKSLAGGEGQRTATGMFLGKVRYASPEQFGMDGAPEMDARGDLYSFGLVLYELLTGRYPISGRDPNSVIAGHLFRPPLDFAESDPQGRVPEGVREAVLAALAKTPADRPAGAQDLSRRLARFRSPGDVSQADLRRALSRSTGETGRFAKPEELEEPIPPGSTQQRLNEHFRPGTTPKPAPLELVPPPPKPVPPVSPVVPVTAASAALAVSATAETQPLSLAELAAALTKIDTALGRGDYRAAEALLYGAQASFGPQNAFSALFDRVEELRRQDLEAKSAAAAAARQKAEPASPEPILEEESASEEVSEELEETRVREARAKRRAEQLEAAVGKIRTALDAGDLDGAGRLLDHSTAAFGGAESLREQWLRLEQLRHQAPAPVVPSVVVPMVAPVARPAVPPPAPAAPAMPATPSTPSTPSTVPAPSLDDTRVSTRATPPSTPSPPREITTPTFGLLEPEPPASDRRRRLILGVAVGLLVLILAGWLLGRMLFSKPDAPPPAGDAAVPSAAAPGTLVIDAAPWGQVTAVTGPDGQAVELPADAYTPLLLTLPPGRYFVKVTSEGRPRPVTLEVEVLAGTTVRSVAELSSVDPDDLFKDLGW